MSTDSQPTVVEPDVRTAVLVSVEMVRLYKEQFTRPKREHALGRA